MEFLSRLTIEFDKYSLLPKIKIDICVKELYLFSFKANGEKVPRRVYLGPSSFIPSKEVCGVIKAVEKLC